MPDFTVIRNGTDPNGRPIFMTGYMADWWERVCDELGFRPTIVQGAFMARAGGGASASAGYHDLGGCLDLRVWDHPSEVDRMVGVLRRFGAAAWLRDQAHGGFDPHIHFVLGSDHPLTTGAGAQWRDYINGGDGIGGRDYHPRPSPLVLTPPEDDMPYSEADLKRIVSEAVADEFDKLGERIIARINSSVAGEKARDEKSRAREKEILEQTKPEA